MPASRRTSRVSSTRIARPPSNRSRVVVARPRLSLRSCLSPKIVVASPRRVTRLSRSSSSSSSHRVVSPPSRRASFLPPSRARSLWTSLAPRARSLARDRPFPFSFSVRPSSVRRPSRASHEINPSQTNSRAKDASSLDASPRDEKTERRPRRRRRRDAAFHPSASTPHRASTLCRPPLVVVVVVIIIITSQSDGWLDSGVPRIDPGLGP